MIGRHNPEKDHVKEFLFVLNTRNAENVGNYLAVPEVIFGGFGTDWFVSLERNEVKERSRSIWSFERKHYLSIKARDPSWNEFYMTTLPEYYETSICKEYEKGKKVPNRILDLVLDVGKKPFHCKFHVGMRWSGWWSDVRRDGLIGTFIHSNLPTRNWLMREFKLGNIDNVGAKRP